MSIAQSCPGQGRWTTRSWTGPSNWTASSTIPTKNSVTAQWPPTSSHRLWRATMVSGGESFYWVYRHLSNDHQLPYSRKNGRTSHLCKLRQYCACWCPGSLHHQLTSRHNIDYTTGNWAHYIYSDQHVYRFRLLSYYVGWIRDLLKYKVVTQFIIPQLQRSCKGGVLVSPCPSVRPSVCPSVDRIVSALYLQQYSSDPFHICTSYQATPEGVSHVTFVSKFNDL